MKAHYVKPGEDLITIGVKYQIADWRAIYNHKANTRLRKFRPDPMCLCEGDLVLIPDTVPIVFTLATNQVHTLQIDVPKFKISLQLSDELGAPMDAIPYELSGKGFDFKQKTQAGGLVEHEVPLDTLEATLKYWPDKDDPEFSTERTLKLGHLDPAEEMTGLQSRLNNLGINAGQVDNDFGPYTAAALTEIDPNPRIDPELVSKLKDKSGT